ncbi:uncharacterized protein LDX57_012782 [Aspergillus melleus]|uniref:uncharacterized protein n=1 Tax=Aspergillus melleus TaxID=138277 RepID=UPI001E8DBE89|nr:uncharacterized protein LDX57_012782 [Aspergillus melleus]KAH8435153.1 hypothetical protein LDX57_012782 [Aspergillus melleus]
MINVLPQAVGSGAEAIGSRLNAESGVNSKHSGHFAFESFHEASQCAGYMLLAIAGS